MDGFDDLLAPSRSTLERNPFADPFAKRSGSPDPWATFSTPVTADADDPYQTDQPHVGGSDATGIAETWSTREMVDVDRPQDDLRGPLDYYAEINEVDKSNEADAETPQTPGFRESIIPSTYSQTETIRNLESEQIQIAPSLDEDESHSTHATSPEAPGLRSSSPPSIRSSERLPTRAIGAANPPDRVTVSPLEPSVSEIDRPFASLVLGGETTAGWQSPQGAWGNEPSSAESTVRRTTTDEYLVAPLQSPTVRSDTEGNQIRSIPVAKPANGIQPVFIISVEDPQKVGDPIRGFTMYTVHTKTTSPLFQKATFSVLRRYSDFLWLYETLSINNPGVVVPPVPDKNPFGRFEEHFVQQRRLALEKCIQKTANHPVLSKDPDLKLFLESDTFALDIKHRKAEIANERGGLMASIGQTIAGPRFHETDEWFDRQKAYLDSLENQLRGLVKAIDVVSKHRTELSTALGEFAQTVSDLSSSDIGRQLQQTLAALGDTERRTQDLQNIQAQQDVMTLMSTVDEYARLINSVRLAFASRIRTYHAWQSADAEVKRVKIAHEKNRAQGRLPSDRLGHSLAIIADAERRALEAKHDFDQASRLIKTEVARFEQERIEDVKQSLQAFLEGMISRQKELISAWESYQHSLLKRASISTTPLSTATSSTSMLST